MSASDGLGCHDALAGGESSDNIDGGEGNDLIAGGAGSDSILGGLGNDFINSSGSLTVQARLRPTDTWPGPPAGQTVLAQGATWAVYVETPSAGVTDTLTIWSGATNPAGTDGDYVDGGAGNDRVIAGGGTDFVQGGTGNDQLHGMGGNDVLDGGDGNDDIRGDGMTLAGYINTAFAATHGAKWRHSAWRDRQRLGVLGHHCQYCDCLCQRKQTGGQPELHTHHRSRDDSPSLRCSMGHRPKCLHGHAKLRR